MQILGAEPLDFSANINPLGSPPLKELFLEELEHIGHYPDNSYRDFRRAAGKFVNVRYGLHRSRKRLLGADQALCRMLL